MPRLPMFAAVLLACFLAPAALRAAPVEGIEPAMEDLEGGVDTLKRHVKDPARREANLVELNKMQRSTVVCKMQTPEAVKKLPAEAKEKMLLAYRTLLIELMRELLALEELLLAGKYDEAAKKVDVLEELHDRGHKALGVEGH